MPEIIILNEQDLEQIITLEQVIDLIERDFSSYTGVVLLPFRWFGKRSIRTRESSE